MSSVRCEFRENDYKRPPVSRDYVAALESRVTTLECLLRNLKGASNEERNAILEDTLIQDHIQPFVPDCATDPDEFALSEAMIRASLQETKEGTCVIKLTFCHGLPFD